MAWLIKPGRLFFAIAIGSFGSQHFIYAIALPGPVAGPPWISGRPLWAYVMGAVLIVASISILTKWKARLIATLLGILLFLYVLLSVCSGTSHASPRSRPMDERI